MNFHEYVQELSGEAERAEQMWREMHKGEYMRQLLSKSAFVLFGFVLGVVVILVYHIYYGIAR